MINLNSLTKNIKDGFKAPTGDSNRETPTKGALRFNTETGKPEIYAKGRGWRRASVSEISAIYTHDNLVAFYDASNADTTGDTSDQYYSDVSLLLHMNGTDGSTTFTDSSNGGHTASVNGGAVISTDQSKFGGGSYEGNGSNSYLSYAASSDFDFGTGDFTVEHWFYLNSASDSGAMVDAWHGSSASGGWQTYYRSASTDLRFYLKSGSTTKIISTGSVSANTWYHIAVTRESGTVKIYLDGVLKDSVSDSGNVGFSNKTLSIGRQTDSSSGILNGYLDEVRITKGVARYTADFTPQTREFYPGTGVEDITSNNIDSFSNGNVTLNTIEPKSYNWPSASSTGQVNFITNNSNSSALPVLNDDITLIVWAKFNNTAFSDNKVYSIVYLAPDNTNNRLFIGKNRSGAGGGIANTLNFSLFNSGTDYYHFGQTLSSATGWMQLTIAISGTSMKAYVNANLEATVTIPSSRSTNTNTLAVGRTWQTYGTNHGDFLGDIAIVKVYDSILSDADITSEFNYHKSTFGL